MIHIAYFVACDSLCPDDLLGQWPASAAAAAAVGV